MNQNNRGKRWKFLFSIPEGIWPLSVNRGGSFPWCLFWNRYQCDLESPVHPWSGSHPSQCSSGVIPEDKLLDRVASHVAACFSSAYRMYSCCLRGHSSSSSLLLIWPCELVLGVKPAKNYLLFLIGLVSCNFISLKKVSTESKRGAVRAWSGLMGLCVILGLEAVVLARPYYKIVPVISRNSSGIVMGWIFEYGNRQSSCCKVFSQVWVAGKKDQRTRFELFS